MVGALCPLPFPTTTDPAEGLSAFAVNNLEILHRGVSRVLLSVVRVNNVTEAGVKDFTHRSITGLAPACSVTGNDLYIEIPGVQVDYVDYCFHNASHAADGIYWYIYDDTSGIAVLQGDATMASSQNITVSIYGTVLGEQIPRTGIVGREDAPVHPTFDYLTLLRDAAGEQGGEYRDLELLCEARALGTFARNAEKLYWNSFPETADEALGLWAQDTSVLLSASDDAESFRRRLAVSMEAHGVVSESLVQLRSRLARLLGKFFVSCDVRRTWDITDTTDSYWTQKGTSPYIDLDTFTNGVSTNVNNSTISPTVVIVLATAQPNASFLVGGVQAVRVSPYIYVAYGMNSAGLWIPVVPSGLTAPTSGKTATFDSSGYEVRDQCQHPGEVYVSRRTPYPGVVSLRQLHDDPIFLDYDATVNNAWPSYVPGEKGVVVLPPEYSTGLGRGVWMSGRALLRIVCKDVYNTSDLQTVNTILAQDVVPFLNKVLPAWMDISINLGTITWTLGTSRLDLDTELA